RKPSKKSSPPKPLIPSLLLRDGTQQPALVLQRLRRHPHQRRGNTGSPYFPNVILRSIVLFRVLSAVGAFPAGILPPATTRSRRQQPSGYGVHQNQQQQQKYRQHPQSYGQGSSSSGYSGFPPGTHPDVIRSFEMVAVDWSGYIDEKELQRALSSRYQASICQTLIEVLKMLAQWGFFCDSGPKEFAALWSLSWPMAGHI
ncbi:unnamed protein product, partial [Linum tenue]